LERQEATFVAVAIPKNLTEAIAAARKVEASGYYGQRLSEYEEVQQQVESKLKDLKKYIEDLALNYANLSS
ncbi:1580_t:CDS:1, partial [Gigaspora margarita]